MSTNTPFTKDYPDMSHETFVLMKLAVEAQCKRSAELEQALATEREARMIAEAQAAGMRGAMLNFTGKCDCDNGHICEECERWEAALSGTAGAELGKDRDRLDADFKWLQDNRASIWPDKTGPGFTIFARRPNAYPIQVHGPTLREAIDEARKP